MKIIISVFATLILIVAGFLFYWFEIRPIKIRTDCAFLSDDIRFAATQKEEELDNNTIQRIEQTGHNEYQFCLRRSGL